MLLKDKTDILGIINEETLREVFGNSIDKLIEIKAFATIGFPSEDNNSDYWGIVNNSILKWCYPKKVMDASLKLLEILDRDFSFWTVSDTDESVLIIKIEKFASTESQKYLIIAPRIEQIDMGGG